MASSSTIAPLAGFTDLLQRWSGGERAALDGMLPLVYDELRRLAAHHLRAERDSHSLPRTALVHEAYLRLSQGIGRQIANRQQFFGLASAVMRHVLVDHARARRAAKRGASERAQSLDDTAARNDVELQAALAVADETIDLVALHEALLRLEQLDVQQARVVEMRFFAGLDVATTAETLELSPSTVKREWATARAWLLRELGVAAPLKPAASK